MRAPEAENIKNHSFITKISAISSVNCTFYKIDFCFVGIVLGILKTFTDFY